MTDEEFDRDIAAIDRINEQMTESKLVQRHGAMKFNPAHSGHQKGG